MNAQDDGTQSTSAGNGTPVPPPMNPPTPPTPPADTTIPTPAQPAPPVSTPVPPVPTVPPAAPAYPPADAYQLGAQPSQPVPPQQPNAAYPPQGAYPPPAAYPPQTGAYPPGAYSPQDGAYPPMGGTMPPQEPEDTTPANFQLGTKLPTVLKVQIPAHDMHFDENYFIRLLAGSISLSREEKKKIIESVPKLKQAQIDELVRIFEEEKQKFAALSKKHVPQLEKLAEQHYNEWMDLENEFESSAKKQEDQSKADEIRKNLGL